MSRRATLGGEATPVRPQAQPIVIDEAFFKREGEGYLPPGRQRQLVVLELDRGFATPLSGVPWGAKGLVWSPSGRLLALEGAGTSDGRAPSWDVFVVAPAERKPPRSVTPSPLDDDSPSFTPDGTEVVYRVQASPTDSPSVTHRLAAVDVATGKGRVLLWSFDGEIEGPRVAPDSRHAWFLLPDNLTVRLARAPLDGGQIEVIVGDEREVTSFDVGAGGRAAFVSSTLSRPPSVFAVTPARAARWLSSMRPSARGSWTASGWESAAVSGASLSNMLGDYGVSDTPFWTERRLGLPWAEPARCGRRSATRSSGTTR